MTTASIPRTIGPDNAPTAPRVRVPRALIALGICLALVAISVVLSVAFGARQVSWEEIFVGLFGEPSSLGEIAVHERVPRTVFALIAGAALSVSGALMQAITRNPIADPGVLGINTGSSLFVVVGIVFFGIVTIDQYIWLAIIGGAATAVFVYVIGSVGPGGTTPIKLALAGVATAAALTSIITAIVLPRPNAMDTYRFWQIGSAGRGDWDNMLTIAPFLIAGALIALLSVGALNALALGDEAATGLGVNVTLTRAAVAVAGVLLCTSITAVAGPIGFVGLMVPHVIRMLVGPDQRWLLPLSALGGAALLTFADTLGRVLGRPSEINVSILTAILGAPILIFIARQAKVREL
ncbi:FecCD family ABC transporter permease [Gulosibacter chungangensis]|uniref:FecCD family ABC transporter permease n=1 Tax=Gulosibacter chungangensis TaxID=979746 RepID=UPI001CE4A475|nr:iron ABC transporter permease [Gulosibacter chungangensis]